MVESSMGMNFNIFVRNEVYKGRIILLVITPRNSLGL
jgi:hypothetical protein